MGTEEWFEWGKTGYGRDGEVVGDRNSGLQRVCVGIPARVCAGVCEGRAKI